MIQIYVILLAEFDEMVNVLLNPFVECESF